MTSESKAGMAFAPPSAGTQSSLLGRFRRFMSSNGVLLLMALPGCIILFMFSYLPMPGIVLAFKNYKAPLGVWGSEWVGFANFQYLFSTGIAWRIIRNTLILNSLFIVTILVVSLVLAILLHEIHDKFISRVYQSVLFFPYFVSYVIVGYFSFILFSTDGGAVNGLLTSLGLEPMNWYSNPNAWPVILVLINLWHGVGYATIIYLAGIIAINPEYYEAARIDGANKLQEIWYIMLPLIRPLIIINVLLAVGRILFANFDLFINVIRDQGTLLATTDVIDTYVFRALTTLGNFNMAAAASMFQATVGFILVVLSNWIVRRVDSDQALF